MKILNLADDIDANNYFKHEHGLCFYIEADSQNCLFDTGATDAFINNASILDIDLKNVDALFISHNHYDHIGGLKHFLEINDKAKIYVKEDAIYPTFHEKDGVRCPVGKFYDLLATSDRVVFVKDEIQFDNLYIMSDTNCNKDYCCHGSKFFMEKDGKVFPDTFTHEMFLVYIRNGMANIITGCSHRGILNIIETVKSRFNLPINYIVGGFHMSANKGMDMNCTQEYFDMLLNYFETEDIAHLYTCHCTGRYAYTSLKHELRKKMNYFYLANSIYI